MTYLFSSTILSFRPNLHSGSPDRYALIKMTPSTSALKTLPRLCLAYDYQDKRFQYPPLELIIRLTVSTTSTNASFLRYLTPALRQLTFPVACDVIFDESSR